MKRAIAIAIIFVAILVAPATAQTFDNSGGGSWKEYMSFPITITPSDYAQYKIIINGTIWELYNVTGALKSSGSNINFWSLVNSSGADIRVFNDSGTQLYFWIERWSYTNQQAVIWVNITSGSSELNIAYGNPNATKSAYENIAQLNGDHFDVDDWTHYSTTVTISNSIADALATTTAGGAEKVFTIPSQFVMRMRVNPVAFATGSNIRIGVTDSAWNGAWNSENNAIVLQHDATSNGWYLVTVSSGTVTFSSTGYSVTTGQYYIVELRYDGSTAYMNIYDENGMLLFSESLAITASFVKAYISTRNSAGSELYADWFLILKLTDPATFGTPIVKLFQKKFGTKTVYVNVTYLDTATTSRYNPIAYYRLEDKPQINVTSTLSVSGVNATYGANISIELINFVTLDKVVYNGTDVTVNLTYQGTITNSTTGYIYNVYNLTTYENGTLEIYGHVSNKAYEVTYKLDGELIGDVFNTTVIIGEPLEVSLPYNGNITIASIEHIGVVSVLVNTKDLGIGAKTLTITIDDPENFTVGYRYGTVNIIYGNLNVSVRHKDLTPFMNAVISVFNENYSILSTNPSKLYAGNNTISVYFHGIKLKDTTVYLNHTTNGASIIIDTNSTELTDFRGSNLTIASPNSFDVVKLSTDYPYSVIGIYNYSGTVVIDFESNPPTSISISGADSYNYAKPVLKFAGSGNATVTDLYKLSGTIKDRLGNPVNFYITVNGSRVDASNGIVAQFRKPGWYQIVAPSTVNGFELWKFNNTSNTLLVEVNATDIVLPTAEYRVPSRFETQEVRLTSLMSWVPIPFFSPKQDENVTLVRLQGTLKDYYGAAISNKNITIKVASSSFTRLYNVTTDNSGNFKLDIDMAKGIEYTVTYVYDGDDVYVGSLASETFFVEQLPSAPPAQVSTLLVVTVVIAIGAGAAAFVYITRKKTTVARTRIESEFRFFRRLK